MPTEPTIHAVDDDHRFLSALQRSLRSTGHVVCAYTNAGDLLANLDPDRPGCVITDLRMPGINGIELQNMLLQRQVRMPIIFMTGHGDMATAITALKNGAIDFLEKPFSERQLLDSVQRALEQDARDRQLAREQALVKARYANLSPREREVFALVVSDRANKNIAHQLKISPRTVEHHREHLRLKMQANSQAELITMAVLCGIHEWHLRS